MGPPRLLRYYVGGLSKFITILHGGGGLPDLLQYYKGEGGVSRDPKFVLRNIWTAPNRENKTQGKVFSYTKSLLMLCGFSVY